VKTTNKESVIFVKKKKSRIYEFNLLHFSPECFNLFVYNEVICPSA